MPYFALQTPLPASPSASQASLTETVTEEPQTSITTPDNEAKQSIRAQPSEVFSIFSDDIDNRSDTSSVVYARSSHTSLASSMHQLPQVQQNPVVPQFYLANDSDTEDESDTQSTASAHSRITESPAGLRRNSGAVSLPSLTDHSPNPRLNAPIAGDQTWSFGNLPVPAASQAPVGLVNDDLVTIDVPRHVNPLFPRPGQVTNPGAGGRRAITFAAPPSSPTGAGGRRSVTEPRALRRSARSGDVRALALSQEGAVGGGIVESVEGGVGLGFWRGAILDEEEEGDDERVDFSRIDAPVAARVRTGLALLDEARQEVDELDVAIPRGGAWEPGHPAAVRARTELLTASGEFQAAVMALARSLADARWDAAEAMEGLAASRDAAMRLAAEVVNLQITAGFWRERALQSEALLREAELELDTLRVQPDEGDDG